MKTQKLWHLSVGGLNKQIETFETKGDLVMDQKLVKYDCFGSIAHAKMLRKIGILNENETDKLLSGLKEILELDKKGDFILEEGDEDVHTAIENYLTQKYGEAGKKIHTGRSRNDQVLTAIRLFVKDHISIILKETESLKNSFIEFSQKYGHIPMPGYTHMQKAMPSSIGLWTGSFTESLSDDMKIIEVAYDLNNQSPLGSAAGYGSPIPLDRIMTAKLLGFGKVQENPLYCQNSRGKIEAITVASLISLLMTINKFAGDVLLFSTSEFGFFEVSSTVCTGSSIMPKKKNIDIAELLKSKAHLLLGNYTAIVSLSSNLPSGYNRDLQDLKKPLFESLEMVLESLKAVKILIQNIKPDTKRLKQAMTKELFAANDAYKLVKKGMSFREAYRKIKKGRYR